MRNLKAAAIAAPILLACPAGAQSVTEAPPAPSILQLDDVVISGSRLGQTAAEVGTSVSVVTAEDIRSRNLARVEDALATVPGVQIRRNGGPGTQSSVFIRGVSGDRVRVLIDGVAVNDATATGGGFDFSTLDTADIERIEVLRGPQSTLWGSSAIGGVINIITRRAAPGFAGSAFGEAGSFATARGGAAVGYGAEGGDIRLSATAGRSDGISSAAESGGATEDDGFDTITLGARGGLNLTDAVRLTGALRYVDQTADFDGFDFAAGGLVDAPNTADTEEFLATAGAEAALFEGRLVNRLTVGFSSIDRLIRQPNDAPFDRFEANGERLFARYQGDLAVTKTNRIAFGVETEETEATGTSFTGATEDGIDSVFGLWETKPIDGLTLTFGARRDETEDFGGETTAKLGAAYRVTEALLLRASAGQGFKAPSLFQRIYGNPVPNPDLRPETSEGFDLGFDLALLEGRASVGATYFNQKIEDEISYEFDPVTFNDRYVNLGETAYEGVELTGFIDLTDDLRLTGAYSYTDARDEITGARLGRRPYNAANLGLLWDDGGPFTATVTAIYNGEELDRDGSAQTVDDWFRVDVAAAYDLTETVEAYGRVENLFDEDYEVIRGYGTPGVSAIVGLRVGF
jgi:vitamin B12 transporter